MTLWTVENGWEGGKFKAKRSFALWKRRMTVAWMRVVIMAIEEHLWF
jgi:hypothetical protein